MNCELFFLIFACLIYDILLFFTFVYRRYFTVITPRIVHPEITKRYKASITICNNKRRSRNSIWRLMAQAKDRSPKTIEQLDRIVLAGGKIRHCDRGFNVRQIAYTSRTDGSHLYSWPKNVFPELPAVTK